MTTVFLMTSPYPWPCPKHVKFAVSQRVTKREPFRISRHAAGDGQLRGNREEGVARASISANQLSAAEEEETRKMSSAFHGDGGLAAVKAEEEEEEEDNSGFVFVRPEFSEGAMAVRIT